MTALSIWMIYAHPCDYPGKYVARRSLVAAPVPTPTNDMRIADTLAEVRKLLPPGLRRIERLEDGIILESWM